MSDFETSRLTAFLYTPRLPLIDLFYFPFQASLSPRMSRFRDAITKIRQNRNKLQKYAFRRSKAAYRRHFYQYIYYIRD